MSKATRQNSEQYQLRLPPELRDQIKADAKANGRSMNAEIIARLEGGAETLRDKVAMAALSGILAATAGVGTSDPDDNARVRSVKVRSSFEYADAFLAARSEPSR